MLLSTCIRCNKELIIDRWSTHPWVPDREAQVDGGGLLEQHGLRPLPLTEHQEELVHQRGGQRVGVQLARARHQHGPRHAAQVAQRVGVDAVPWEDATATSSVMYSFTHKLVCMRVFLVFV